MKNHQRVLKMRLILDLNEVQSLGPMQALQVVENSEESPRRVKLGGIRKIRCEASSSCWLTLICWHNIDRINSHPFVPHLKSVQGDVTAMKKEDAPFLSQADGSAPRSSHMVLTQPKPKVTDCFSRMHRGNHNISYYPGHTRAQGIVERLLPNCLGTMWAWLQAKRAPGMLLNIKFLQPPFSIFNGSLPRTPLWQGEKLHAVQHSCGLNGVRSAA